MPEKHRVEEQNAGMILDWLQQRGGIAIWNSADFSNPGRTWTTPVNNRDGTKRTEKPHWSADQIIRVITDSAEIEVVVPKELHRFHVAVRTGSNRMILKLRDASSKQLRRAVAKAAREYGDAWYEFDYSSHKNAVVFIPAEVLSLDEWRRRQASAHQEQRHV